MTVLSIMVPGIEGLICGVFGVIEAIKSPYGGRGFECVNYRSSSNSAVKYGYMYPRLMASTIGMVIVPPRLLLNMVGIGYNVPTPSLPAIMQMVIVPPATPSSSSSESSD